MSIRIHLLSARGAKSPVFSMIFWTFMLLFYGIPALLAQSDRMLTDFNKGWKFAKGAQTNAQKPDFDDANWQQVRLPHDWAIAGPFNAQLSGETGKLPWQGEAWYRKSFELPASATGKRVYLLFDGVMAFPQVYINGQLAGSWDYGYTSFYIDITNYIKPGTSNTAAVYVDTRAHESRWYPGAGIYRKVQLLITDPVHVDIWGTQITTPDVSARAATVKINTSVINADTQNRQVSVQQWVLDASGNTVAADSVACSVKAGEGHAYEQFVTIAQPRLWDINQPQLYTLKTQIKKDGQVCDTYSSTFGIRSIHFTANDGFWLNGRRVQLKGVNQHHDLGALGAAFNLRAAERQLEILRDMGCNAVRTSHNTPAPELLDLCDKMGFLVIDELFDKWDAKADIPQGMPFEVFAERQVNHFMRRDRNHPCIFLWSVGNEIGDIQGNVNGGFAKLQTMARLFRAYDPTRLITLVCDNRDAAAMRHMDYYDVISYNYSRRYDLARQLAPHKSVIITESASTVSTRGFYELPLPEKKTDFTQSLQVSSYDLHAPWWAEVPEDDFKWQQEDAFVAGEFVWTGFDYLGEPTPYGDDVVRRGLFKQEVTPRSSYFGIVDLAGLPKDRYYLYKSHWNPDATTVHILPHWNWPGYEGKEVPVFVYTNGDCAELFLNGKSLGKQCKKPDADNAIERCRLMWRNVKYAPGTLKVVAYKNGQVIGEKQVKTAGAAAQIQLSADRAKLKADGNDLSFVTVELLDKAGNFSPLADNDLQISITGPAEIAGLDNGNPLSLASFQGNTVKAFFGKAMLIVRSKEGQTGLVELKVQGKGLKTSTVRLMAE